MKNKGIKKKISEYIFFALFGSLIQDSYRWKFPFPFFESYTINEGKIKITDNKLRYSPYFPVILI